MALEEKIYGEDNLCSWQSCQSFSKHWKQGTYGFISLIFTLHIFVLLSCFVQTRNLL